MAIEIRKLAEFQEGHVVLTPMYEAQYTKRTSGIAIINIYESCNIQ